MLDFTTTRAYRESPMTEPARIQIDRGGRGSPSDQRARHDADYWFRLGCALMGHPVTIISPRTTEASPKGGPV